MKNLFAPGGQKRQLNQKESRALPVPRWASGGICV